MVLAQCYAKVVNDNRVSNEASLELRKREGKTVQIVYEPSGMNQYGKSLTGGRSGAHIDELNFEATRH